MLNVIAAPYFEKTLDSGMRLGSEVRLAAALEPQQDSQCRERDDCPEPAEHAGLDGGLPAVLEPEPAADQSALWVLPDLCVSVGLGLALNGAPQAVHSGPAVAPG